MDAVNVLKGRKRLAPARKIDRLILHHYISPRFSSLSRRKRTQPSFMEIF